MISYHSYKVMGKSINIQLMDCPYF